MGLQTLDDKVKEGFFSKRMISAVSFGISSFLFIADAYAEPPTTPTTFVSPGAEADRKFSVDLYNRSLGVFNKTGQDLWQVQPAFVFLEDKDGKPRVEVTKDNQVKVTMVMIDKRIKDTVIANAKEKGTTLSPAFIQAHELTYFRMSPQEIIPECASAEYSSPSGTLSFGETYPVYFRCDNKTAAADFAGRIQDKDSSSLDFQVLYALSGYSKKTWDIRADYRRFHEELSAKEASVKPKSQNPQQKNAEQAFSLEELDDITRRVVTELQVSIDRDEGLEATIGEKEILGLLLRFQEYAFEEFSKQELAANPVILLGGQYTTPDVINKEYQDKAESMKQSFDKVINTLQQKARSDKTYLTSSNYNELLQELAKAEGLQVDASASYMGIGGSVGVGHTSSEQNKNYVLDKASQTTFTSFDDTAREALYEALHSMMERSSRVVTEVDGTQIRPRPLELFRKRKADLDDAHSLFVTSGVRKDDIATKAFMISTTDVRGASEDNLYALEQQMGGLEQQLSEINEVPVGAMVPYAGPLDKVPNGWLPCDGRSIPQDGEYAQLFAVLGVQYGGGSTTFNLPNVQGRTLIGSGSNYSLGRILGEETHTLTVAEMPSHNHNLVNVTVAGGSHGHAIALAQGGGDTAAISNSALQQNTAPWYGHPHHGLTVGGGAHEHQITAEISSAGGSQPFTNMQPSLAVNYIIKYK